MYVILARVSSAMVPLSAISMSDPFFSVCLARDPNRMASVISGCFLKRVVMWARSCSVSP